MPGASPFPDYVVSQIETEIRYRGYIEIERSLSKNIDDMENKDIPHNIDYKLIKSLKTESCEKLSRIRPRTLGHASRIPGVNPTDIALLSLWIGRHRTARQCSVTDISLHTAGA